METNNNDQVFDWEVSFELKPTRALVKMVRHLCRSMAHADPRPHMLLVDSLSERSLLLRTYPELRAYRDVVFWWKYYLNPDVTTFPNYSDPESPRPCPDFGRLAAQLKWGWSDDEKGYQVTALDGNAQRCRPDPRKTDPVTGRLIPADMLPRHRYASTATPGFYLGKPPVRNHPRPAVQRPLSAAFPSSAYASAFPACGAAGAGAGAAGAGAGAPPAPVAPPPRQIEARGPSPHDCCCCCCCCFAAATVTGKRAGQVRTEDDVIYRPNLPAFEVPGAGQLLSQRDSELLLSFLTVPYLRLPLVLAFFASDDRVHKLQSPKLKGILDSVLFEPGRYVRAVTITQWPQYSLNHFQWLHTHISPMISNTKSLMNPLCQKVPHAGPDGRRASHGPHVPPLAPGLGLRPAPQRASPRARQRPPAGETGRVGGGVPRAAVACGRGVALIPFHTHLCPGCCPRARSNQQPQQCLPRRRRQWH